MRRGCAEKKSTPVHLILGINWRWVYREGGGDGKESDSGTFNEILAAART